MGGDARCLAFCHRSSGFNPRPRMGGDAPTTTPRAIVMSVSIHAPAWGATPPSIPVAAKNMFQSTPPHGGRHEDIMKISPEDSFNPRPRMGGDPEPPGPPCRCNCFNPRPRMGGDTECEDCGESISVSIHAPAWGATATLAIGRCRQMFQSTPPHGGRHAGYTMVANASYVSIHAPAWGATTTNISSARSIFRFNPRPRMGGDGQPWS